MGMQLLSAVFLGLAALGLVVGLVVWKVVRAPKETPSPSRAPRIRPKPQCCRRKPRIAFLTFSSQPGVHLENQANRMRALGQFDLVYTHSPQTTQATSALALVHETMLKLREGDRIVYADPADDAMDVRGYLDQLDVHLAVRGPHNRSAWNVNDHAERMLRAHLSGARMEGCAVREE